MNKCYYLIALTALSLMMLGCQKKVRVQQTSGDIFVIDSTLDAIADSDYIASIEPYRREMQAQMDEIIGECLVDLTVDEHGPECPMLNWASDALLEEARKYYPGHVDCSVVNKGGMRCEWLKGPLTIGSVFRLMPFDNQLVVLTLSGEDLLELGQIYINENGQGCGGMRIYAEDGQLIDVAIATDLTQTNWVSVEADKTYHVATSDYLSKGMDKLTPLTHYTEIWNEGWLIRDLYIEYIKEHKQISAAIDGRSGLIR